ncbi:MAG: hypothetical protein EOO56_02750 [Hymenobacter sp.]|nr:MAG: hypothetical protein EOO56_02750 [Hymenobacter sp.]
MIFAMVLGKMEVEQAAATASVKYGAKVRVGATLPHACPYASCLFQQMCGPRSFFAAENQRNFNAKAFFSGLTFDLKTGRRIFAPPKTKMVRSSRG